MCISNMRGIFVTSAKVAESKQILWNFYSSFSGNICFEFSVFCLCSEERKILFVRYCVRGEKRGPSLHCLASGWAGPRGHLPGIKGLCHEIGFK
jgi:hypothetical protein